MENGGQQMIAHIGTKDTPNSQESLIAKQAWLTFISRVLFNGTRAITNVTGGTPYDYYSGSEFQAAKFPTGGAPLVAGYFDPTGTPYALLLAPIPNNKLPLNLQNQPFLKVADVKRMTMMPWKTIEALRTFHV
jgi:hypothetical protein